MKFKRLDACALLARGEEPFSQVRKAVDALKPGEGLAVKSPFLPSPLIERLGAEGFRSRPEHNRDGSWTTYFWRDTMPTSPP
jgi:hypothetical protein